MSEIKLFDIKDGVRQLVSSEVLLERELQTLIEKNMETLFGVRFLKSEYSITNGRMMGREAAELIDWSVPCVICVANDFTKYDVHAVNQMQRNIKLVKYRKYDNELILFEYLNTPVVQPMNRADAEEQRRGNGQKTHIEKLAAAPAPLRTLYEDICNYIESLGDDIVSNQLKLYLAYKKVQNLVCIEIYSRQLILYLKLNPDTVNLEEGFTRDMRNIGHYGTGDLQVIVKSSGDFEKAKKLIERAYSEA